MSRRHQPASMFAINEYANQSGTMRAVSRVASPCSGTTVRSGRSTTPSARRPVGGSSRTTGETSKPPSRSGIGWVETQDRSNPSIPSTPERSHDFPKEVLMGDTRLCGHAVDVIGEGAAAEGLERGHPPTEAAPTLERLARSSTRSVRRRPSRRRTRSCKSRPRSAPRPVDSQPDSRARGLQWTNLDDGGMSDRHLGTRRTMMDARGRPATYC